MMATLNETDIAESTECLLDFKVADTAGDGYIEFREFVAWWTN
jgi:hypothetical protein